MKQYTLKLIVFIWVGLLGSFHIGAQTVSLPYFCGFETEIEQDGWVFVNGNNANRWTIGKATAMRGVHSLYISADGGATTGVTDALGVSGVYKKFELPGGGTYEVSFDWKSQGGGGDTLLVAWIDDDPDYRIKSNVSGVFPLDILSYEKLRLAGSTTWQHTTITVTVPPSMGEGKLVFLFGKKASTGANIPPGACIDNVQIGNSEAGSCVRPKNIEVESEAGALHIAWEGEADSYNLAYKDTRGDEWTTVNRLTDMAYTINNPEAGVYTFWIQSVCGTDTTIWSVYQYVIVSEAAKNCINYVDLHSDAVHVYYGDYDNPFEKEGIMDFGEENYSRSRHTVNVLPDRYDPYTGYKLSTIPKGDLASIRLGNPSIGREAEAIVYDYVVDPASTIVLLKYAVVLENAHLGAVQDQALFLLEVLDENDNLISDCAKVEFVPEGVQHTWNSYETTDSKKIKTLWKDWTAFGVDVSPYIDEKIKIRLTTKDCRQKEHSGYAYFTLNCIPKEISGLTCGETPDSISAPDGFKYEWYHITDMTDILSTQQTLFIDPNDTATYVCHVISPEDPTCYFEMKAVVAPRFPKADAKCTLIQEDCKNMMQFENTSYVYTENGKTGEAVNSFYWDFGELGTSEDMNPLITFDKSGDYPFKLYVEMNDGQCTDVLDSVVHIPKIGDVSYTKEVYICKDSYYMHDNKALTTEGLHEFKYKTRAGCDSLFVIDLKFYESFEEVLTDTVCFGTIYEFHGDTFDEPGVYNKEYVYKSVVTGCDSTYVLNLTILPEITYELTVEPALEGNDGKIMIDTYPENFIYYTLNGIENTSLEGLEAGEYELTFFTQEGTHVCEKTEIIEVGSTCLVFSLVEEGPFEACADEQDIRVLYSIDKGVMKTYDVSFDDAAIERAGFENVSGVQATEDNTFIIPLPQLEAPAHVLPGNYMANITFPGQPCDTMVAIPFTVRYPSSIITQRWDNVLFLQNEQYNGGYTFSAYQWYKDEEAIEGATASYLHVAGGLDMNAEYSVEVTRADDGVMAFTCPVTPYAVGGVTLTLQSNVVPEGGEVQMTSTLAGTAMLYDVSGVLLSRQAIVAGDNRMQVPAKAGYYLMQVELDNGQTHTYHVQVVK